MHRRWLYPGLMLFATAAAAQQPVPTPDPTPPSPSPESRYLPPEVSAPRRTPRVLAARRARLGIFFSMRSAPTDSIGAVIERVTPNSPADRAGLHSGDIITRFNGQALVGDRGRVSGEQSAPGLALALLAASVQPGDTVAIEYRRGGRQRNASVVAGDEPAWTAWALPNGGFSYRVDDSSFKIQLEVDTLRARVDDQRFKLRRPFPPPMVFMMGTPLEDLELAPKNRDLGRYFGTADGVLVISVPEDSRLGLQAGDVILSVDGRVPAGPAHLLRILRSYEGGEPIRFELMRMKKRVAATGRLDER
jgi:S1-C subfamily serine protease